MYSIISFTLNMSLISSSFQLPSVKREVKKLYFSHPWCILSDTWCLWLAPEEHKYCLLTAEIINTPVIVSSVKKYNRTFHVCGTDIGLYLSIVKVHIYINQKSCLYEKQIYRRRLYTFAFCLWPVGGSNAFLHQHWF